MIAPFLHKLRDEGLIKLIQVDLDQNRPLGNLFNVTAIPTLVFFKDGTLVEKDIVVGGDIRIKKGLMVGACGEDMLRLILEKI
ncbi:MAG: thioredoxin family protein [Candidatus Lokiarchaeota archaeon]|nr:thioredoxin family protein [Candidatus Lokiarchaeota archaeon]